MSSPFRAEEFRSLFPIFGHKTYLNSCSSGAAARPVLQAIETFSLEWAEMGSGWEERWYDAVLGAEDEFARLIGANADEVVYLPNVSSAIAAIASAFNTATLPDWGGRTRVLVPVDEFPTIGQIWLKQQPHGLHVVEIPAASFDLAPYLGDDTLIVALSHVNYSTGRRRDLPTILAQAHQAGALVLIDDSQSAGTRPVDVAALGIDILVASGHKYLLGTAGAGSFLFVRKELINRLEPTIVGWAAHRDFIRSVERQNGHFRILTGTEGWNPFAFEYSNTARRFSGGTANIVGAYAARAGLSLVRDMDPARVATHVEQLAALLITGCLEMGIPLKTPLSPEQRGPMVVIGCSNPTALVACLAQERIEVSERGSAVRLSLHGYNLEEDVHRALAALSANLHLFAPLQLTEPIPGNT